MSHRGQLHCLDHTGLSFHSHRMGPSLHSPIDSKIGTTRRASSQASEQKKRVPKACDRCRAKKSKCDGASPCNRCIAANDVCLYGERVRSRDKVYPKGYVENLERQQVQVVACCQLLYAKVVACGAWEAKELAKQPNGHPLTHDLLEATGLLYSKTGNAQEIDTFEEDHRKLEARFQTPQDQLFTPGTGSIHRQSSPSSDSSYSRAGPGQFAARTLSNSIDTPSEAKPNLSQFDFCSSSESSPRPTSRSSGRHGPPVFQDRFPSPPASNSGNTPFESESNLGSFKLSSEPSPRLTSESFGIPGTHMFSDAEPLHRGSYQYEANLMQQNHADTTLSVTHNYALETPHGYNVAYENTAGLVSGTQWYPRYSDAAFIQGFQGHPQDCDPYATLPQLEWQPGMEVSS